MLFLADTSDPLDVVAKELGCDVGQLITPLTRRKRTEGYPFAIDTGVFSGKGFRRQAFDSLLAREAGNKKDCLFVVVPDVVGSARRTEELFHHWIGPIKRYAYKTAYVIQDGQEDIPIPWHDIDAIFVGGSTAWKFSDAALACIQAAKVLGKWVHMGRVNTPNRWDKCEALNVDSVDGTGLSRFSHMRQKVAVGMPLLGHWGSNAP